MRGSRKRRLGGEVADERMSVEIGRIGELEVELELVRRGWHALRLDTSQKAWHADLLCAKELDAFGWVAEVPSVIE